MAINCPVPTTGNSFLSGTLYFIDCATQTLAGEGYKALALPTSSAGAVLGLLLVLFVAGYGFRLLGGALPTRRELLWLTVKLGAVLTLAGSWDAYRVLVYNPVLLAPAEIMADLGQGAGLGGSDLVGRLQVLDQGMLTLTRLGSGYLDVGAVLGASQAGADTGRTPLADTTSLAMARIIYLVSVIAVFGALRLITGLLLALGPLFAGLLLFDATRGLFLGWARLLFGSLVGAVAVTALLEVELALLLPWLNDVLTLRIARVAAPSAPVELLVLVAAFGIMLFIGLGLVWRLVLSPGFANIVAHIDLPAVRRLADAARSSAPGAAAGGSSTNSFMSSNQVGGPMAAAQTGSAFTAAGAIPVPSRIPDPPVEPMQVPVPLGQSYRRQIRALSGTARRGAGRA